MYSLGWECLILMGVLHCLGCVGLLMLMVGIVCGLLSMIWFNSVVVWVIDVVYTVVIGIII